MRQIEESKLDRLWEMCVAHGIGEGKGPRRGMQVAPFLPDNKVEQCRVYMLESLFTGLYTDQADILLRAYVQAHGYVASMDAYGEHQPAYIQDLLRDLRDRVESHFLRSA